MNNLTFERLTEVNVARCKRWHTKGLEDWSPEKWFLATVGELGETANALKKLWRIEHDMANISEPGRQLSTREEAIKVIGAEVADTVIYFNLFATRIGLSLKCDEPIGGANPEALLCEATIILGQVGDLFSRRIPMLNKMNEFVSHMNEFCDSLNIDLESEIIAKFNATSEKYNFPERL